MGHNTRLNQYVAGDDESRTGVAVRTSHPAQCMIHGALSVVHYPMKVMHGHAWRTLSMTLWTLYDGFTQI
jgi:hypothetical protein